MSIVSSAYPFPNDLDIPANRLGWRESTGADTPMMMLGQGYVQYACQGPGASEFCINLLGGVADSRDEPECLFAASMDGYDPFFLRWKSGQTGRLGCFSGFVISRIKKSKIVTLCWRQDLNDQTVQAFFTIPFNLLQHPVER